MSGNAILIDLLAGVALLIWATRLVRTGVVRAFGDRLRNAIGRATANPVKAWATGMGVATAMQSSSATALLVVSFADRGLIALAPALALMLGADIGSTLAVQILAFKPTWLSSVLLIVGVPLFTASGSATVRQVGRIVIGVALMIISLGIIVGASEPLRESPTLVYVLEAISGDLGLAFVFGAVIAWLAHSSLAAVLLVIALSSSGVVAIPFGVAFVLGANVGSAFIPMGIAFRTGGATARRILIGNLVFRITGSVSLLALMMSFAIPLGFLGADPARALANVHTGFNVLLAIVFLPLTYLAAKLLERIMPDAHTDEGTVTRVRHLDEAALDRPAVALGAATREVMRIADTVQLMLQESINTFADGDERRLEEIARLDDEVDRLQEEVKLYLTKLTRQPLTEEDSRRCFDLILFTTNLEHAGDIIDKGILRLAARKKRNNLAFSQEGWAELQALHQRVVDQMRLAVTVFVTRDLDMARELVVEKDRFRDAERLATESHLQRLREGTLASIETSALHLDLLRDLKRITAHLTTAGYPILEASGALRGSRLRKVDPPQTVPGPEASSA
jgi:phosphate:Na+ symporter